MLYLGFTGPRFLEIREELKIEKHLAKIYEKYQPAVVVTGGCTGADYFIARWFDENTTCQNIIVVPAPRKHVEQLIYQLKKAVFMEMAWDKDKSVAQLYEDRNRKLVEMSDKMIAFRRVKAGGTQMTINLAKDKMLMKPIQL